MTTTMNRGPRVLAYLIECGPCTQQTLAEAVALTGRVLNRALEQLTRQGLITSRVPPDHHASRVYVPIGKPEPEHPERVAGHLYFKQMKW